MPNKPGWESVLNPEWYEKIGIIIVIIIAVIIFIWILLKYFSFQAGAAKAVIPAVAGAV